MSAPSSGDKRHELERRLTVAHHLPSLAFFSVLAIVTTAGLALVWPISGRTHQAALASESVSNHHRLIATECERCHSAPFTGATDDRCLSCHTVGAHAEAISSKDVKTVQRCASCHKEHHGQRSLVPVDSPLCTGCHSQITTIAPKTLQPAVRDFAHHPEFSVRTNIDDPTSARVLLDTEDAVDNTMLKFSHAEHVGRVQNKGGSTEMLACTSCHVRSADAKLFKPIEFVRHCERCHQLDFDPRIKGTPVPHGNVDHAIDVVRAAIAEFNLNANEGTHENTGALRDRVDKETRETVDALFNDLDGCKRCHEVIVDEAGGHKSFRVVHPRVRSRWLPTALFDHSVHRQTACEQCHKRARTSTTASDILVPGIRVCRDCHADPGTPDKVESPCVECHVYHAKQ